MCELNSILVCESKALGDKVFGELFDAFVKFPRVLGDSVLHFGLDVEGSDDDEVFGDGDAGASVFLDRANLTFLR